MALDVACACRACERTLGHAAAMGPDKATVSRLPAAGIQLMDSKHSLSVFIPSGDHSCIKYLIRFPKKKKNLSTINEF